MSAQERLKEIEKIFKTCGWDLKAKPGAMWLISRVKELEQTIEKYKKLTVDQEIRIVELEFKDV